MPWSVGPPSWPGALQGSQGGFGGPGRVAPLWVCLTRSQHRWDGALLANLEGLLWLPVQVSPHLASLHPFGQGHPLSPNACIAAAVCFLMPSKAFLSPFSQQKSECSGQKQSGIKGSSCRG